MASWVNRKTDQKLIFNANYIQIVFFVIRIHFHYVLLYLFDLFRVRTCLSILCHTLLIKFATFVRKNCEKRRFWRFFVIFAFFDATSLMTSLWRHTRSDFNIFGTNGLMRVLAIHQYPTLDVSSIGPPPGCEMGRKSPALWGLKPSVHRPGL